MKTTPSLKTITIGALLALGAAGAMAQDGTTTNTTDQPNSVGVSPGTAADANRQAQQQPATGAVVQTGPTAAERAKQAGHTAADKARDVGHSAADKARDVGSSTADTARNAGHAVGNGARGAANGVTDGSSSDTSGTAGSTDATGSSAMRAPRADRN